MQATIPYTIRKSARATQVRITVRYDGSVVVTCPARMDESRVAKFFADKSAWVARAVERFAREAHRPTHILPRGDYRRQKGLAQKQVEERVVHFNKYYGFSYKKVSVRNQRSRWGSCSKSGNLSFNYKLVHLPEIERDYIIVHELCHLKEFNHSKRFWSLVAETIPEYKTLRKSLKLRRFF